MYINFVKLLFSSLTEIFKWVFKMAHEKPNIKLHKGMVPMPTLQYACNIQKYNESMLVSYPLAVALLT